MTRVTSAVRSLWETDRPLTAAAALLFAALLVTLCGLWLDPRTITGVPAWLKPAKFAISTVIYTVTLAWIFMYLPEWTKTRRIVGWTTAVTLVLEVVLISLQAWRGTTSHFNIGSTLDAVVFGIMGVAIAVQTLASIAVAVALWRQPFVDRSLGWALRLGLAITIAGASLGGLMTRPTADQLRDVRATGRMPLAGAHTVGGPDGGPGLVGTGWSREHGDLRVPHFLGLHAVQALPLLALLLGRRRMGENIRIRLTVAAAADYGLLVLLLLWQALRGQSITQLDATGGAALGAWLFITLLSVRLAVPRQETVHSRAIAC
jgi:hypothetical protein